MQIFLSTAPLWIWWALALLGLLALAAIAYWERTKARALCRLSRQVRIHPERLASRWYPRAVVNAALRSLARQRWVVVDKVGARLTRDGQRWVHMHLVPS